MNPALQGYFAAVSEQLAADGTLTQAADELAAVSSLVDGNNELTLALDDGSVPAPARRAVLDDLLDGKVLPEVRRVVNRAVTVVPASEVTAALHWLTHQGAAVAARVADGTVEADASLLGRLASRNRVAGYAAAVFEMVETNQIEEIEDQLFRFARTVESNPALRTALGDRDLPATLRQEVVTDLLGGKGNPATVRLVAYSVKAGRARDIVGTLDALVEAAARARGWRVARVVSSDEVADAQRQGLSEALGRLAGNPVELQVTVDPSLLGGVVVQLGDLLVDGSARHRLDQLTEHLLGSEADYHVPQGRETADG
ncbi:MAG TPA: ATP synthase F1 subunit delta [Acidimicrobiales bacterium]|nr:ATP synthase F1 subunit delta [Acidimicrobiales bacterium]